MTLLRAVRRAPRLSRGEWFLLIEAALLASTLQWALKRMPFNRLLARIAGTKSAFLRTERAATEAACALAVERAYRVLPFGKTCLTESLVLLVMLLRRGAHAELRIGVRKSGRALAAHAWVAAKGVPSSQANYCPLVLPTY